jgi:transposase
MSVIAPVFSFGLNGYAGSGLALQDKAEKRLMQITIGIDISKETLDAYRFPDNHHIQVANGRAGHKSLVRWIGKQNGSLVVFEATGAYHRNLEAALAANGTAFAKVNPRQARRFAEATGRLAKTDRVDAIMLAKMGAILGLKAHEPKTEALHILRELITARRALMKDKVAAKTRLQTTRQTLLKNQINARLKQIDIQIRRSMSPSPKRSRRTRHCRINSASGVPGIAEATAFSMLIEMPELGTLEGNRRRISPA